jgi:hypothetical protein
MSVRLTDAEIERFIRERKQLPPDYRSLFHTKPKQGHQEQEFDLAGDNGSRFRILLRQSSGNPFDFSAILALLPAAGPLFRLRRYNGKSHQHTNGIEKQTFYDFHVHQATERYQDLGMREDTFAETTDRYADMEGAIRCMLNDCGFVPPDDGQARLFGEEW